MFHHYQREFVMLKSWDLTQRIHFLVVVFVTWGVVLAPRAATADEVDLPDQTYMPAKIDESFESMKARDEAAKPEVMRRQQRLLEERYDLRNDPSDVPMSGGRKAVQQGVRVRLPAGMTWQKLAAMSPDEIKNRDLFPMGFRPLPHAHHASGGQVFPRNQIEAMEKAEQRDLSRFDVDFDLPDHLTPEFPPPIFLTTRPDLGDVSQGEVLSIKNYYQLMKGKLTPVQMEGLRLLLTPFPQQQFNQTEDRKVLEPSLGVTCFDCHVNGHTNAAFHLDPDTRPQAARSRLDTPSLRGMFNQQIHGSKRSLRSIEDFTEFEQRTAYFDGDHVLAAKKGVHLPDRASQVAMMAQMQNIFNFPPAPKLDEFGLLRRDKATAQELMGQAVFFGKGRCAECHPAPFYLDNQMHDLRLERFYEPGMTAGQFNKADGPIKTFTLRGIKDSPPYHHDGRLLTLEDTVEFFNLVLRLQLDTEEKEALTAFMRCL
jgi:cytochrome c peroxidase